MAKNCGTGIISKSQGLTPAEQNIVHIAGCCHFDYCRFEIFFAPPRMLLDEGFSPAFVSRKHY